jgi:hypothetical protein
MIEAFNRLDERHPLDTTCAEDIAEALLELARSTGVVPDATAEDWFDRWRNF